MDYQPPIPSSAASPLAPGAGGPVAISPRVVAELQGTRTWVRIVAFVTALVSLLVIAFVAAMALDLARLAWKTGSSDAFRTVGALGVVCLGMALFSAYPVWKMMSFAGWVGALERSRAVEDLERALLQQRLVWRFYGIVLVVYVVLFTIGMAFAPRTTPLFGG